MKYFCNLRLEEKINFNIEAKDQDGNPIETNRKPIVAYYTSKIQNFETQLPELEEAELALVEEELNRIPVP